jgi:hypothetical protein
LAQDLLHFDHVPTKVIQYADDILLCAPTKKASQEGIKALFNFLAKKDTKFQSTNLSGLC